MECLSLCGLLSVYMSVLCGHSLRLGMYGGSSFAVGVSNQSSNV